MVASEQPLYQIIVLSRKLTTGSIHEHLFCYCPLVGILFKVLRIILTSALSPSLGGILAAVIPLHIPSKP